MRVKPFTVHFFGSGRFAALILEGLVASGLFLEQIVTGAPTFAGRGMKERVSPVQEKAIELNLPFETTGPLDQNETLGELYRTSPPDIAFVIDFGQKVREPFLSGPRFGCLNLHPSLLPKWRGAAPVPRSLEHGDVETGVTLFRLVEEMDAGPILAQEKIFVPPQATSGEILSRLSQIGCKIAMEGIDALKNGSAVFREQDSSAVVLAPKIAKEESLLKWTEDALAVHNRIRAFNPAPGAYFEIRGKRLKVWKTETEIASALPGTVIRLTEEGPVVACGVGALLLKEVQPEGKRSMPGSEWARGLRLQEGDLL